MGKPTQDIKKKQEFKSPVSPFWLGVFPPIESACEERSSAHVETNKTSVLGVLGFVVFGGLVFELLSRFFM